MDIRFDYGLNAIGMAAVVLAWGLVVYLTVRLYGRQPVKPGIWRAAIVVCIGLISFSIDWSIFGTMVKIPLLPLGVWLLYWILKRKSDRWEVYRKFAWLGFWSNFIFLASAVIAIPLHQGFYPKEEPATYIAQTDNLTLIGIHPSAKEQAIDKESLLRQINDLKKEKIEGLQWYSDTVIGFDPNDRSERFPYQLIGANPRWGSGLHTIIFIEEDGKGLLITTADQQLYFRADQSLLEAVK